MSLSLEAVIAECHRLFSSDKVCVDDVKDVLAAYKSNPEDWKRYAIFDEKTRRYTRNLIDVGNGKFNLLVLCWPESQGSAIHDHSNSHCFVKILDGTLRESLYNWPKEGAAAALTEMVPKGTPASHTKDMVTYISDEIGLHRMENPSHTEGTVTLHLYSPPFDVCHVFDDNTSQTHEAAVTFWSVDGRLTEGVNECAK